MNYVKNQTPSLTPSYSEKYIWDRKWKTHFGKCDNALTKDCIEVLASTQKTEVHLITLEALFIKEIEPTINTKDEYRQRTLKIKL